MVRVPPHRHSTTRPEGCQPLLADTLGTLTPSRVIALLYAVGDIGRD